MVVNLQFLGGRGSSSGLGAAAETREEAHAEDAEKGKAFNGRQRSE